ncbi:MAG: 4Fe-4S dicluster domain-containing protein [Chloroflexi bacterium]|nr:4Fe-4S dicluster domain-containing protein [Chloroflexota bacterium]
MPKDSRVNWWTRRTEVPPYEVVGPIERIDARDQVGNRARLVPGTPAYEAYYAAHPEREAIDRRFRLYATKERKRWKQAAMNRKYPFAIALSFAVGAGEDVRATNYPEEPIAPQPIKIDPRLASENIKQVARHLGADLVGICEINPDWVWSHRPGDNGFAIPVELKYRYAIVVAVAKEFNLVLSTRGFTKLVDILSNETRPKTATICSRLAGYIHNLGYPAQANQEWVVMQALAVDAGLGEMGRGSSLVTKEFGPNVVLGAVFTDMPLVVDKPVDLGMRDFCTKCLKCAINCPTKSIPLGDMEVIRGVKLWHFDAESCYRLRTAAGDTHICVRCISTCPWTKPQNIIHRATAEVAVRIPFTRRPLIWLDDFLYGRKPRQHPLPSWLEPGKKHSLKQRIITALHKI